MKNYPNKVLVRFKLSYPSNGIKAGLDYMAEQDPRAPSAGYYRTVDPVNPRGILNRFHFDLYSNQVEIINKSENFINLYDKLNG